MKVADDVKTQNTSALIITRTIIAVLMCVVLMFMHLFAQWPAQTAHAQSDQPDNPIETTVAAFMTFAAARPTATRPPTASPTPSQSPSRTATPTATPTSTSTPTPTLTSTPTRAPSATPISATATLTPTLTSTPTLTPTFAPTLTPTFTPTLTPTLIRTSTSQPTLTPTETPQASRTPRPATPGRSFLPAVMKNYPCEAALPDCFEDNNGLARAYGPLRIGQSYVATEEINIDRYDYYTVTLTSGTRYTLTLVFPRYDVDLYVYGNGPAYSILAQSATTQNGSTGGTEKAVFTPTITAQYYVLAYTYAATGLVNYTLRIE